MRMYYEASGAGAPLIVLHGAYINIPSMGGIIPKLAETHTVYALELGHGSRSAHLPEAFRSVTRIPRESEDQQRRTLRRALDRVQVHGFLDGVRPVPVRTEAVDACLHH